jgi:hypothetical protein
MYFKLTEAYFTVYHVGGKNYQRNSGRNHLQEEKTIGETPAGAAYKRRKPSVKLLPVTFKGIPSGNFCLTTSSSRRHPAKLLLGWPEARAG